MIIANAANEEAESQAGDVADAALQAQIDEINLPDNTLQEAIDANAVADEIESQAGDDADAAIQADVNANEAESNAADAVLQSQITSIGTTSSDNELQMFQNSQQLATNTNGITNNTTDISELQGLVESLQSEIENLINLINVYQGQLSANTEAIEAMDGEEVGQMNYWSGSSWIAIPLPPNDGTPWSLRMIDGIPTWDE